MTIADITLAAFTLCNSFRVVAYLPQIARAARDRSGAEAISVGTWGLFLVSWVGSGLCARQPTGLDDGVGISGQRRWLWRDPRDCRLETIPMSPPADRQGFTRTLPKGGQTVGGGFSANCGFLLVPSLRTPTPRVMIDASIADRSAPEVLEPIRRQLGVAHGVLDVLVPQPSLQCPRVVAGVGQSIAAAVAPHVRMYPELHLGPSPDPTE